MGARLRLFLSPEEDYTLFELRTATTVPQRVKDRAQIIRLNAQGWYVEKIATHFHCHPQTVRQTLKRWQDKGLGGLWVTDKQIIEWAKNLSQEWLEQPFEYKSNVDGKTRILPIWLLVTHMFNHQTHHRGQLTTLLSKLGYDPGITDLPWLPSLN